MDCFITMKLFYFLYNSFNNALLTAKPCCSLILFSFISTIDYQRNNELFNLLRSNDEITFDQFSQIENLIESRHIMFEDLNNSYNTLEEIHNNCLQMSIEFNGIDILMAYVYTVDLYYCLFDKIMFTIHSEIQSKQSISSPLN